MLKDSDIQSFAEMVRASSRIAVLSGAGISTPSGIPDFRSTDGIYAREENQSVFDIHAFLQDPSGFYRFAQRFYPLVRDAEPNAAHLVLAAWERAGKDIRIATQNIDDLHERAGSSQVFYVHGNVGTSTCQACFARISSREIEARVAEGEVAYCPCGGVFKPDITFFGEMLPEQAWMRAGEAMSAADLVVIVGTSLVVYPAASLPDLRRPDAGLVIVNRDPTHLDRQADITFPDDLEDVFARVGRCLEAGS